MTYRRGPEYRRLPTRIAVIASAAFATASCSPDVQSSPTSEIFPNQPQVSEATPIPTEGVLVEAGIAQDRSEILAGFGGAVGAGGSLSSRIEKVFNNSTIQGSLNRSSLAPIIDSDGGITQIGSSGDQRVCFPNMPEKLFNPNVASEEDSKLETREFVITYGDIPTQEARFQGLGAVALENTRQDLICVNAIANSDNNPFGVRDGVVLNVLIDRNNGDIYGTLPSIYGADQNVRFDFATSQVVVDNVVINYEGPRMAELTVQPTFRSEINELQDDLREIGVETEVVEQENGDIVLNHEGSRGEKEIGVFGEQGGEFVFVVTKENGKTASFSVDQVRVDSESEQLQIVDEEENILFAYIHQVQKLYQYADLPYLTGTTGRLNIVIGDSFDRDDGYGFSSLRVGYRDFRTPGSDPIPTREFRDPGTGQLIELDSAGRLSLATEIAQVITAQAWDPTYTFADLREGKLHQIRTLDGEMHEVDPSRDVTFYWTGAQPRGEYYTYPSIGAWKFWWAADEEGALSLYASVNPEDQIWAQPWNVDVNLRQALLTMMVHQHLGPNNQINHVPYGSGSYLGILPSSKDRSLVKLLIYLVHEIDQEKLQEMRSQLRPGQEPDYEFAQDTEIDLIWVNR